MANPAVVSRVGGSSLISSPSSSSSLRGNGQMMMLSGWRWSSTIPRVVVEKEEQKGIKVDAEKVCCLLVS